MNAKRILIPLDLVHSTIDPLVFVQGIAAEAPICATLLYVVAVNLSPAEQRVYEELCSEAQAGLMKLAKLFFGDEPETRVSVRIGRPHQQILVEARSSRAELIIMAGGRPGSWGRLFGTGTTERVVRAAPCPTLVLPRGRVVRQFVSPSLSAEGAEAVQWTGMRTGDLQAADVSFADESNRINVVNGGAEEAGGIRGRVSTGLHKS